MKKSTVSRRQALGFMGAQAASLAGLGRFVHAQQGHAPSAPGSKKLALSLSGYRVDRVDALMDGRVSVDGCHTTFEVATIGQLNTDVFSGRGNRQVTEIGLTPFILAYANDDFRGHSLLPIFPLRLFRHKNIFIRTDRGIERPEDLRGKRVATPGYSSTSLTWIRGILKDEYSVSPEDIEWYVSSKDSSAAVSGSPSKQEAVLPDGIRFTKGPEGKDESDMLADGDVDALFHAAEPRAYLQGHPKVARLFADYRRVERAYFEKTGIFPIMHAVAIRNDLIEKHPWLPEAVCRAYSAAKQAAYDRLKKKAWYADALPWIGQEVEETRALMGDNYWPYGIEPNRKALETLLRYCHEQGLASRLVEIEEIFHSSALPFREGVGG